MKELILAVDDEPLILHAYQRNLGEQFQIVTAEGPTRAFEALARDRFAVVLSDLRMPELGGIDLLEEVRRMQPDAVRMLISGHADLSDAINSINQAGIFRLLLKPCPTEELERSLEAGLAQYRLIQAERALLENTLNGAVQALLEILSIADGEAIELAQLRRQLARRVAAEVGAPVWEFEMAAQLAEIGRATLPPALNEKLARHASLSEVEARLVERVPEFSHELLKHIPRLEGVARGILYQSKNYDGSGHPDDRVLGDEIPLSGRALRAINALLEQWRQNVQPMDAIAHLHASPGLFDPAIVEALPSCENLLLGRRNLHSTHKGPQNAMLRDLVPGMELLADMVTNEGMVVLAASTRLTAASLQRIRNFSAINPIREPLLVELRQG